MLFPRLFLQDRLLYRQIRENLFFTTIHLLKQSHTAAKTIVTYTLRP